MILPDDDSITLAETDDELVVDASSPPATDLDAVLALFPGWVRDVESAPIRDAVALALGAVANLAWARAGQVIARLMSPRFAGGIWLDAWGELKKLPRQPLEEDGPYRARLLELPDLVTPNAIRRAVERIEPAAICIEPAVDGAFYAGETSDWACYYQPDPDVTPVALRNSDGPVPAYYQTDTSQSRPEFWVALPPHFGVLDEPPFYGSDDPTTVTAFYGGDDPATVTAFYGSETPGFATLISEVESRRAAGVPWIAFIDPCLETLR